MQQTKSNTLPECPKIKTSLLYCPVFFQQLQQTCSKSVENAAKYSNHQKISALPEPSRNVNQIHSRKVCLKKIPIRPSRTVPVGRRARQSLRSRARCRDSRARARSRRARALARSRTIEPVCLLLCPADERDCVGFGRVGD